MSLLMCRKWRRVPVRIACAAVISVAFIAPLGAAQQSTEPTTTAPQAAPLTKELDKYPGLLDECEKLFARLQKEVQLPPPRTQSSLLAALPESTVYYGAFPNYGDAAHQALTIFNDELRQSTVLRNWWQHEVGADGPMFESYLENVYQLSQYLGDELVVFGGAETGDDAPVLIAQVRKAGLENFLRQWLRETASASKLPVRVLNPQELSAVPDGPAGRQQILVVTNAEFVIVGSNPKNLRTVSALLRSQDKQFASSPFGQRLMREYNDGAWLLFGADVHELLSQLPRGPAQNQQTLERTGFSDMKYLVWECRRSGDNTLTQAELSFTGPRHGAAAWLAQPVPLNSLDLVSPDAVMTIALKLKNFAEIFDDVKQLATYTNPAGWNSFEQMQQAMGINLREDLLSHLDGEITLELDRFTPPQPVWKAMLRVNHPEVLQQTLDKLLKQSPIPAEKSEENGIEFHTLHIPSSQKPQEITYAYSGDYMVLASARSGVEEALRAQKTGESLMKSQKFLSALPPDHSVVASGMFFEDPIALMEPGLEQAAPAMASTFSQLKAASKPVLVRGYGEESAIREISSSSTVDPATIMIVAAIAIPNLLRAKMAANESSAVANLRTIVTAQITYATEYPQKGYAADLASLGSDPRGPNFHSSRHAGVIDATLGDASCTAGAWCSKSGFRFTLKASCGEARCRDFVAIGTPESANSGAKNFCATSDGVVRFQLGPPLNTPITASQCKLWAPLQ